MDLTQPSIIEHSYVQYFSYATTPSDLGISRLTILSPRALIMSHYILSVRDLFLVDGRDWVTSNHDWIYYLIQIITFSSHLGSAHAAENEQIAPHATVLHLEPCRKRLDYISSCFKIYNIVVIGGWELISAV